MLSQSNLYNQYRAQAKEIFNNSYQLQTFRFSKYNQPQKSEIEKAIARINCIPNENKTDEDIKTLLNYHYYAAYLNVQPKYLYDYNYSSGLEHRKKIVELLKQYANKLLIKDYKNKLATALYNLAVAYARMENKNYLFAKQYLTEAIALFGKDDNFLNKFDLDNLIDCHREAGVVAENLKEFDFAHLHYYTAIHYSRKLSLRLSTKEDRQSIEENIEELISRINFIFSKQPKLIMDMTDKLISSQKQLELNQNKIRDLENKNEELNKQSRIAALPKKFSVKNLFTSNIPKNTVKTSVKLDLGPTRS